MKKIKKRKQRMDEIFTEIFPKNKKKTKENMDKVVTEVFPMIKKVKLTEYG